MFRNNPEHRLTPCPGRDIKHGEWTPFRIIEKCKGIEQVESHPNYTCGSSRTIQRKDCVRDRGGEYCKNEDDEPNEDDILVRTVRCNDTECPGEIRNQVN